MSISSYHVKLMVLVNLTGVHFYLVFLFNHITDNAYRNKLLCTMSAYVSPFMGEMLNVLLAVSLSRQESPVVSSF